MDVKHFLYGSAHAQGAISIGWGWVPYLFIRLFLASLYSVTCMVQKEHINGVVMWRI